MGLMDKEMQSAWLFETLVNGQPRHNISYSGERPSVIFKFLHTQLVNGHLTVDEVVNLLLSKSSNDEHYFLTVNRESDVFYSLLNFYKLLSEALGPRAGDILKKMTSLYCWLINLLGESKYKSNSEEFTTELILESEKLTSTGKFKIAAKDVTFNESLMDDGPPKGTSVSQYTKVLILLFYKFVQLARDHVGIGHLNECLKSERVYDSRSRPNVIHHLLDYTFTYILGCVCSTLMQFLKSDDIVALLFMENWDGNNVFHETAKKKFYEGWGILYDVARTLLKEETLSNVHSAPNRKNVYVQDFFLQMEADGA